MIAQVREAALRLLTAFADEDVAPLWPEMTRLLLPRPGDVDRVFVPAVTEQVEVAYQRLFTREPVIAPNRGQTQVLVSACTARMLANPQDPAAGKFPGGYKRIAHLLLPDRIWIAWKFVEPGRSTGLAFNGLVYLDDRFVWFPRPWIALGVDRPDELQQN